jgi:hypothetical protein
VQHQVAWPNKQFTKRGGVGWQKKKKKSDNDETGQESQNKKKKGKKRQKPEKQNKGVGQVGAQRSAQNILALPSDICDAQKWAKITGQSSVFLHSRVMWSPI